MTSISSQTCDDTNRRSDSEIVKDLVMSRFGEIFDYHARRSLQRRGRKTSFVPSVCDDEQTTPKQKLERPNTLGFKNSSSRDSCKQTPDSGLNNTEEEIYTSSKSSPSLQKSNDTLGFSGIAFLNEALGEEHKHLISDLELESLKKYSSTPKEVQKRCIKDKSVGTNDISTLISTEDRVDSVYTTPERSQIIITPKMERRPILVRPLFNPSPFNFIPETVKETETKSKSEDLNDMISSQCVAIAQLLRASHFCRHSPRFAGTAPHLEVERCVLLATYKRELLEKQLNEEYEELEPNQCYGAIHIKNLVFFSHSTNKYHYFLCLVRCKDTVLASEIVKQKKDGDIIFNTSFRFDNLLSDFEIDIKLFRMSVERFRKGKSCLTPKKLYSPWKNQKESEDETHLPPNKSAFKWIGSKTLNIADVCNKRTYVFEKIELNESIYTIFDADILSTIKITNRLKGFLTIAVTKILWKRQWCSLDGRFLKCWNYPDEEKDKEPIEIFNLSDCAMKQVNVDKTVCPRARTFMLEIRSQSGYLQQHFFQADTNNEFEEWKTELNSVLISLSQWRYFNY